MSLAKQTDQSNSLEFEFQRPRVRASRMQATKLRPPALMYHRAFHRPYPDSDPKHASSGDDKARYQDKGSYWEEQFDRRLHRIFQRLDRVTVVRSGLQPEYRYRNSIGYFTRYFDLPGPPFLLEESSCEQRKQIEFDKHCQPYASKK